MEHKYPGVVDHLVEQGWTKLVLFARDNPLGVGPTTTLAQTRAHSYAWGQLVGPQLRVSNNLLTFSVLEFEVSKS
jgi:hypothetical protein